MIIKSYNNILSSLFEVSKNCLKNYSPFILINKLSNSYVILSSSIVFYFFYWLCIINYTWFCPTINIFSFSYFSPWIFDHYDSFFKFWHSYLSFLFNICKTMSDKVLSIVSFIIMNNTDYSFVIEAVQKTLKQWNFYCDQ